MLDYCRTLSIDLSSVRMGVIVQQQITAQLAGVLFTRSPLNPEESLIEWTEGTADDLLMGREMGTTIRISRRDSTLVHEPIGRPSIDPREYGDLVRDVLELGRDIEHRLGWDQVDIEWAFDGSSIYVVQARPVREWARQQTPNSGLKPSPPISIANIPATGLKGWAATYFQGKGLAPRNLATIPPHSDPERVARGLAGVGDGPLGTVIRFSYETAVGLKRRVRAPRWKCHNGVPSCPTRCAVARNRP